MVLIGIKMFVAPIKSEIPRGTSSAVLDRLERPSCIWESLAHPVFSFDTVTACWDVCVQFGISASTGSATFCAWIVFAGNTRPPLFTCSSDDELSSSLSPRIVMAGVDDPRGSRWCAAALVLAGVSC